MQDFETIRRQLANEEAALASTHAEIDAASRHIDQAHREIEATKRRIESTQQEIERLHERAETVKKRISLLRQYFKMLEADQQSLAQGGDAAAPAPGEVAAPALPAGSGPSSADGEQPATPSAAPRTAQIDSGIVMPPGMEEDELGELPNVDPQAEPAAVIANAADRNLVSFDNLDEDFLTHELLPRTRTFDEELLLLMAYHRKAIKLKDVLRTFRRLDYAPKLSVDEAIKAHVEGNLHLFEYVGDRIVLTHEGREEAERLLTQLI